MEDGRSELPIIVVGSARNGVGIERDAITLQNLGIHKKPVKNL
jgi:hypothetical protein